MNSCELRELVEQNVGLAAKLIRKLNSGEVSVREYLDGIDAADQSELSVATRFNNFGSFKKYIKAKYPGTAEEDIAYMSEHYEIARKHGIKEVTFGVLESDDGSYQVLLADHQKDNCGDWSKKRLLGYIRDFLGGGGQRPEPG